MSTPTYSQNGRPVRIHTPLSDDTFLIRSFTGTEALGRPFEYKIVLLSEDDEIDHKEIIGKNVTILVDMDQGGPRYFNGYVSRFAQTNYESNLAEYKATIVPWLWFLTRSSDCRVFQTTTIPDIIKQVFRDHGFTDVIDRLADPAIYRKWDYCVQYRESAFNFVSRLMEEEGIYYYFKHETDKHSLVLCDSPAHKPFDSEGSLLYRPSSRGVQQTLWAWSVEHEVESSAYYATSFDFTASKRASLRHSFSDPDQVPSHLEQFDYLGEQSPLTADEGERYAGLRLQELQAPRQVYGAAGDARTICTGVRFTLQSHPRTDFNQEYLTSGADYTIEANSAQPTTDPTQDSFKFLAKLIAIPLDQQFRPARITPKPHVHGPQSATVVGPSGQQIYTDQYGRVKVQFHWDRVGASNENSSCWVRVSQIWAGKNWGGMFIPHIGQEVLVDCFEGDPDRPIITGRVYNDDQMPPMTLPDNKTKAIIQDDYGNRITMDATSGHEKISIYCPTNRSQVDIGEDVKIKTENDSHTLTRGESFTATVGDNMTVNCGVNVGVTAGVNASAVIGAQATVTLAGSFDLFMGMKCSAQFGGAYEFTKGFKYSNTSGAEYSGSNDTYHKRSDEDILLDADQNLCLIGGDKDHTIVKMGDDGILLSVGVGGEKASAKAAREQKTRMLKALGFGLLMTVGAAGALMTGSALAAKNETHNYDPDVDDPDAQKLPDVDVGLLAASSVVLGAVAIGGAIKMGLLGKEINEHDNIDPAARTHTDVHSSIELKDKMLLISSGKSKIQINKDGTIVIDNEQGNGAVELRSKGAIKLISKEAIEVNAPQVQAKQGIFESKNIQDIG